MQSLLEDLKRRLATAHDLAAAASVLSWDQATYMPPGGAAARGRQLATLGRIAHEHATDVEIGRLLDQLEPWATQQDADSDDAALVRVVRRDYERGLKIPSDFVAQLHEHLAISYDTWTSARPENDFARVRPHLEKTLDLSRRYAELQGTPAGGHLADPLIDESDEGMTVAMVQALFSDLRKELVPLVQAISAQPVADDACLRRRYPEAQQWQLGEEIIEVLGYDFERGRQDKTHHPFMTSFSIGDVRITTRFRDDDLSDGLFSTIHEAGHALYEQGIDPAYEGLPLAGGASTGVHESQSRLWENVVARSRGFWEWAYPGLCARFPEQLADVPLETFYRAVNRVQRSLVRVDADEVTYNLHVMIRFDLELAMLEGKLAVRDLPEAWNERYRSDLGVVPPDDRDGVLQDVHWFGGTIGGAFQGYTLGNILSAQFFERALQAHPSIPGEIRTGRFDTLHGWLRTNLYRFGRKYPVPTLIERATGQPLTIAPYMSYLRRKFGELYEI